MVEVLAEYSDVPSYDSVSTVQICAMLEPLIKRNPRVLNPMFAWLITNGEARMQLVVPEIDGDRLRFLPLCWNEQPEFTVDPQLHADGYYFFEDFGWNVSTLESLQKQKELLEALKKRLDSEEGNDDDICYVSGVYVVGVGVVADE